MKARKYIRIALSAKDEDLFAQAKAEVERDMGIAISDSMFALSIVRKAIQK